jgi:predicted RecA/RadA family phage recombinase
LASLQVEGVFEFTATTADVIAFGAAMYYIVATKLVTTTAGSNIPLGRSTTEKAAGVAGVARIKLESL